MALRTPCPRAQLGQRLAQPLQRLRPLLMHLLRPPPLSDSNEAAAAPLAKPKPGCTGKKSAKGRAGGAGNTVPMAKEAQMKLPAKNATTIAAAAPPPSSDSDEAASPLAKPTTPGSTGKKPSKRRVNASKNSNAAMVKHNRAKKAKTTPEKVCPLIL